MDLIRSHSKGSFGTESLENVKRESGALGDSLRVSASGRQSLARLTCVQASIGRSPQYAGDVLSLGPNTMENPSKRQKGE